MVFTYAQRTHLIECAGELVRKKDFRLTHADELASSAQKTQVFYLLACQQPWKEVQYFFLCLLDKKLLCAVGVSTTNPTSVKIGCPTDRWGPFAFKNIVAIVTVAKQYVTVLCLKQGT
jgi:hypothetical protein